MKTGLLLFVILLGANVFASEMELKTVSGTCNLADLSKADNGNIQTRPFHVEVGRTEPIATYAGHSYTISAFDVSYEGRTRYQLSLSARDTSTNKVVGSSYAIFSNEIPDLIHQDGPNIILNCMQP